MSLIFERMQKSYVNVLIIWKPYQPKKPDFHYSNKNTTGIFMYVFFFISSFMSHRRQVRNDMRVSKYIYIFKWTIPLSPISWKYSFAYYWSDAASGIVY